MIPDFKTFINESLFGNMSDKGRGEVVKKEDNIVNNLDIVDVYNIVKDMPRHGLYAFLYDDEVGDFEVSKAYDEDELTWDNVDAFRRIEVGMGDYDDGFTIKYRAEKKPGPVIFVEVNGKDWTWYHKLMDIIKPTKVFDTKTLADKKDFYVFPKGKKRANNATFIKLVEYIANGLK